MRFTQQSVIKAREIGYSFTCKQRSLKPRVRHCFFVPFMDHNTVEEGFRKNSKESCLKDVYSDRSHKIFLLFLEGGARSGWFVNGSGAKKQLTDKIIPLGSS